VRGELVRMLEALAWSLDQPDRDLATALVV
jgi:hypothetical protein